MHSPALDLLQLVDLFRHLGGSILLLLAEGGDLSLVLQGALLHVTTQLQQLLLALLVQLDLHHTMRCSSILSGTTSMYVRIYVCVREREVHVYI